MGWVRRLGNLWRRERVEAEIAAEIEAHLAMAAEEQARGGLSEKEARRRARLRFGNPATVQERTVRADAALGLAGLWRDVRYAVRQLRRSPGFAATVVLTLAVGIGANLAVFQLLYGILLEPLPVAQPAELVSLRAAPSPFDGQWFFSYPAYQRLREATGTAAPVIARSGIDAGILQTGDGASGRARYQLVSDNFFSGLGVGAAAGRMFEAVDAREGPGEWPVVLRYGFARERFGAANVVGRHAVLNGVPVVVVGVAARRFGGVMTGYAPDLWLPLEAQSTGHLDAWFDSLGPGHGIHLEQPWSHQEGIFWLWTMARVPESGRAAAAARWRAAIQPDLALTATAAETARGREVILHAPMRLIPAAGGEGVLRERSRVPLFLLMGMAGAIFLAGCLNLANLQVARLSARQRELEVRMALGAGRWRLLRQVLVEDALLALAGFALAGLVGRAGSAVLLDWASGRAWPLDVDLHPGLPAAGLGAALLLAALAAFSLAPAWRLTGRSSGRGTRWAESGAQTRAERRRASLLLAAQVSLSLLLAGVAGCFAATMIHLGRMDAGMDRAHELSVHVDMTDTGYAARQKDLPALYRTMTERIEALPQVRAAAVAMCAIPGCGWNTKIYAFGQSQAAQSHGEEDHVGPGYFRALGISLLRGRDFSASDRENTQRVAIVNEAYAKKLFGAGSPIGHWIGYEPAPGDHTFLIVGEVANARLDGLREEAPAEVYLSIDQKPAPIHSIEVLATGAPDAVAGEIRAALRRMDASLPVTEIVPLNVELGDGLATEVLMERLALTLAAITIGLAVLGFYGLLSFRVARRRGEIGVRMALGASRREVQGMVLRQTAAILAIGTVPGIVLTAVTIHAARSLLAGSAAGEWLACALAAGLLGFAGLAGAAIPARRAAQVDPMEALRAE